MNKITGLDLLSMNLHELIDSYTDKLVNNRDINDYSSYRFITGKITAYKECLKIINNIDENK